MVRLSVVAPFKRVAAGMKYAQWRLACIRAGHFRGIAAKFRRKEDRSGIWVENHFLRIESMACRRVIRAFNYIGVIPGLSHILFANPAVPDATRFILEMVQL